MPTRRSTKNSTTKPTNRLPYLTADQLKLLDQKAVADFGIPISSLMEYAGLRVAEWLQNSLKKTTKPQILILAGIGNNAGDAFVSAKHLTNWGYQCHMLLSHNTTDYSGLPGQQLAIAQKIHIPIFEAPQLSDKKIQTLLKNHSHILDGLLGFGISAAPRDSIARLITLCQGSSTPIYAIDCPSGLNVTTGSVYEPCIRATQTLTLAALKTGFKTKAAKKVLGALYLADIGFPKILYQKMGIHMPDIFKKAVIMKVKF